MSKFYPSTAIVPNTILSVNQPHINKKLFALNSALQCVLFNFVRCVITLSVDNIYIFTFFSSDRVRFSYYGNQSFARMLDFLINTFASCYVHFPLPYCPKTMDLTLRSTFFMIKMNEAIIKLF